MPQGVIKMTPILEERVVGFRRLECDLGLLKPAGYPAVIGGACDGVPVTGMSQSVDIDANGFPVIIQSEALGQEDHSEKRDLK